MNLERTHKWDFLIVHQFVVVRIPMLPVVDIAKFIVITKLVIIINLLNPHPHTHAHTHGNLLNPRLELE
jgi:hypothetical protein